MDGLNMEKMEKMEVARLKLIEILRNYDTDESIFRHPSANEVENLHENKKVLVKLAMQSFTGLDKDSVQELIVSLALDNSSYACALSVVYYTFTGSLNNRFINYIDRDFFYTLQFKKQFDYCLAHEEKLSEIQNCTNKKRKLILIADYHENHARYRGKLTGFCRFMGEFSKRLWVGNNFLSDYYKCLMKLKTETALRCLCVLMTSITIYQPFVEIIADMKVITENEIISESVCNMISMVIAMVKNGRKETNFKYYEMLEETDYETYRIERILNHEALSIDENENADENQIKEDMNSEDLYRKVSHVLNNLTPENFSTLVGQFKTFPITTHHQLQGVLDLLFTKALERPKFSIGYAILCRVMGPLQVPLNDNTDEVVSFKSVLISRCQKELKQNYIEQYRVRQREIESHAKLEFLFNIAVKIKTMRIKQIGNIKFIGELFKQHMVTVSSIMQGLHYFIENKGEDQLQWLCILLTIIGKELEDRGVNLNSIFNVMGNIVGRKSNGSSCVRSMLQDVIELRKNKWQDMNPQIQFRHEVDFKELYLQDLEIKCFNTVESPGCGVTAEINSLKETIYELNKTLQKENKLEQTESLNQASSVEINNLKETMNELNKTLQRENKLEQTESANNAMLVEINNLKETLKELIRTIKNENKLEKIESCGVTAEINCLKETINELNRTLQKENKLEQTESLNQAASVEINSLKETMNELNKTLLKENKLEQTESLNQASSVEINNLKETINELNKTLQKENRLEQTETIHNNTLTEINYLKTINQQKDELIKSLRRENKLLTILGKVDDEV